jgi:hypothetical protein
MPSTVGGKEFLGGGSFSLFPMCSHHVPLRFPKVPKNSTQVVPEDVPNSNSDLLHVLCPKYYNSYVYELKMWAIGERSICF